MMVAMVLLGVVLAASASTFITSFVAIARAETRTVATALLNEELENLRAIRWADLGFYSQDFSPEVPQQAVVADGDPVIVANGARPAGTRSPARTTADFERGGVRYTIERTVEWVDLDETANEPYEGDYKRLVVTVSWTDSGGNAREVRGETLRSPNPNEQLGSDFVLSLYGVAPEVVEVDEDGVPLSGGLDLTALTSVKANFLRAEFETLGGSVTHPLASDSEGLEWSSTYSSGAFRNGDVLFTFVATRTWPAEQEVLGRKAVRFVYPLDFRGGSPFLEPSSVGCIHPTDGTPEVTLTVNVDGVTDEDLVTVTWPGEEVEASPRALSYEQGTVFDATIAANTYTETTTFTVSVLRRVDDATLTADVELPVTQVACDV
jgi:hypothetical protein